MMMSTMQVALKLLQLFHLAFYFLSSCYSERNCDFDWSLKFLIRRRNL